MNSLKPLIMRTTLADAHFDDDAPPLVPDADEEEPDVEEPLEPDPEPDEPDPDELDDDELGDEEPEPPPLRESVR